MDMLSFTLNSGKSYLHDSIFTGPLTRAKDASSIARGALFAHSSGLGVLKPMSGSALMLKGRASVPLSSGASPVASKASGLFSAAKFTFPSIDLFG